jgi:hypothetical protein
MPSHRRENARFCLEGYRFLTFALCTYIASRERTWTKTGQKWVAQIGLDGAFNI